MLDTYSPLCFSLHEEVVVEEVEEVSIGGRGRVIASKGVGVQLCSLNIWYFFSPSNTNLTPNLIKIRMGHDRTWTAHNTLKDINASFQHSTNGMSNEEMERKNGENP